ncbi:MAG: glycerol-3-phosphate responsive antiterminator [Lachnospiraceae bacterium]|nr:glycerol-3-phosphate responsive antiterminator [Lachnospiraceae bacterium]
MDQKFYDMVEANPVIAAIKDMDGLEKCCRLQDIKVIFILYGDICNITDIVRQIKEAGKLAIVHVDLIAGLGTKEIAVDFIKHQTGADGIISTKPTMIRRAKELGLYTVMRFFILDSISFENIEKQLGMVKPDFIEILPGVMPKIIRRVCKRVKTQVIAGGLITDKEDIMAALDAGAISVSSTNQKVWMM